VGSYAYHPGATIGVRLADIGFAASSVAAIGRDAALVSLTFEPFSIDFEPTGGVNVLQSDGQTLTSDGVDITW